MDVLGLDERHVGKIGLMKRKEDDTQYSSYHQCHMQSILFFFFCFFFLVEFISSFLDSQLFLLILLTSWRNHKKSPDTHFRINIFFQLIDKSYIQSSLNDFVTIRQQRQQLHVWPHPNPKKQVMHAIVRSMASNFFKGVFGKGGGG